MAPCAIAAAAPRHGRRVGKPEFVITSYSIHYTKLYEAVRAAARRHGVADLVTFPGWRGDVERLLDAADALFHPALTEAFGLGVAEAMARGVPVAAFAIGGVPEVLGGAGILVRPDAGAEDTRSGFLSALATLLADPETYAARGRARAGENFGFARFEARNNFV